MHHLSRSYNLSIPTQNTHAEKIQQSSKGVSSWAQEKPSPEGYLRHLY